MDKVVFLKPRVSFKGGLEKYTKSLMEAFAKKGCQVTLLTTGKPLALANITTHSLAPDSKFTLYQLRHFDALCQKWLKQNPSAIVFGMERTTRQTHLRAGNGVHAVYLKRRALIDSWWKKVTFPFNPLHRALLSMEKKAFEAPDLKTLFTNSSMVKEEILSTYTTAADKISVVHNGVEWEKWGSDFEQTFTTRRQGPFQFLFIGNGYKRKGIPFLLRGLSLLKREDFRLTVIGKEKRLPFFVQMAQKLGLEEKVSFLGPQTNVLPFYQQADALVLPSIYDPFANVTVEALAMGLFVVTSCYNGGKEVLHPETGTLINDLASDESVAAALKKSFEHPKTEERARKIRQSIKELDFSIQLDKIVQKTLSQ